MLMHVICGVNINNVASGVLVYVMWLELVSVK